MARTTTEAAIGLPSGPSDRERALYGAFDALEAKLARLPALDWRRVIISRDGDRYDVEVVI